MGGQYHGPAALPPGKTRYPLYRRLISGKTNDNLKYVMNQNPLKLQHFKERLYIGNPKGINSGTEFINIGRPMTMCS
jgi:hypothetical protein